MKPGSPGTEMGIADPSPSYIIVSPVKDEERYVELTLRAVTSQTLKPLMWVIVDDGSRDDTPEIIRRYLSANPFIRLVRNPHAGIRQPGSAVMRAFQYGFGSIGTGDFDFIVKLDCDLSFGPEYFEGLLAKFREDGRLGIASGVYLERGKNNAWKQVVMPSYHAAGACKVICRGCFEDIRGFVVSAGWDTVDEIRANARGWKTGHFADLRMKHHKSEGSGIGKIRTSVMHGEIYYRTGGSRLFFLLKVLRRMGTKPYGVGALALLWGYLTALWERKAPLVTSAEATCYQALLSERMQTKTKALFARGSASSIP
jgi:glycosyltransferase involved in cell wall biosynthesis